MGSIARPALAGSVSVLVSLAVLLTTTSGAQAQDEFFSGRAAQAWEAWSTALDQVLTGDPAAAEDAFGELLALDPSPLRLALLAERTTRTASGGALLLLEQDADAGELGPNAARVLEMLETGREQYHQADDGWYFASIGRFDVARANFRALLDSDPDPVALLEYADSVPDRQAVLVQLVGHPIMDEPVRDILALLREGERAIKSDPVRIRANIQRLVGPPRMVDNAVALLKDSGEYAVPFLIEELRRSEDPELVKQIVRLLPQIDRPALNPLVAALDMGDDTTRIYIVQALGRIGHPQAVPYLLRLAQQEGTTDELQAEVTAALATLRAQGVVIPDDLTAAAAMFDLAEMYYENQGSLAADPRLATANVWYWREDILQNVPVPTDIFNEVMCMRSAEKALTLEPDMLRATALWLAANFRRVAQLGDNNDATRPDVFPPPEYFARTAGSSACQLALARAVKDGDPAVALGTIDALRRIAGTASLIGDADTPQPLVAALTFPNRMVRIQAGLALAAARPQRSFPNDQNLMPVLAEALTLHAGLQDALVVDPDQSSRNAMAGHLREAGYSVVESAELLSGMQRVREERPGVDVVVLASDVAPSLDSALQDLDADFRFAMVPVVLIAKPADAAHVRDLVRADYSLGRVSPDEGAARLLQIVDELYEAVGAVPVTTERGLELARQATAVLRVLAIGDNPLFVPDQIEVALLDAFTTDDASLKIAVAEVLGYLPSEDAQAAIANVALDAQTEKSLRLAMFAALADSAKRQGNLLSDEMVERVRTVADAEGDMELRTAATQALGALDQSGQPASEFIRKYSRG